MTDYERLAKCMNDHRLAKVQLDPEGNVLSMIALPPEAELVKEDFDPQKIREEAERIAFAHVEGF